MALNLNNSIWIIQMDLAWPQIPYHHSHSPITIYMQTTPRICSNLSKKRDQSIKD